MEQDMTDGVALEPGTYRDFTGYINYDGIEGYAENADFILVGGYDRYMHGLAKMIWNRGTWRNGRCGLVEWLDGTWLDGTFESGSWRGGTWCDGVFNLSTFYAGTWNGGTFLWSIWWDGTWNGGVFRKSEWHDGAWNGGMFEESAISPSGSITITMPTANETGGVPTERGWR